MSDSARPSVRGVAVALFFVALALYLLTYVGAFKTNDERAMFSSTDSVVKRGEFTTTPIFWDYTNVGMLTRAGDMVPNYEPAQSVLAIPLYLLGRSMGAAVQAVMLFAPLGTALSVALLFLSAHSLGYERRIALIAALIYGAATIAWPFSKSFFRDPLAAFSYLLAFYALLRYRSPHSQGWAWAALAGVALGLGYTTKQVSVAFWPAAALLFGAELAARHERRLWLRDGMALAVPLLLILGLGALYEHVVLADIETFKRNIVDYTTNPQLSSTGLARMLRGFLGLTISPFRGLLWYAPILWLGVVGAVPFVRRQRVAGLAILSFVALTLLGYSRYNFWSAGAGGAGWGPRYLLGIVPFVVLLSLPVLERLVSSRRRAARWGLALLLLLSVGIQLIGVALNTTTYELRMILEQAAIYGGVGEAIDATYLDPRLSPVVGNLRLLMAGTEPLDVAWVPLLPEGQTGFRPALLALLLANLGLAVAALWAIWRGRAARWMNAGLALAALGTMGGLLLAVRDGDARFDPYNVDRFLRPMLPTLAAVPCEWRSGAPTRCAGTMVAPDPLLTDYFLTRLDGPLPWYAISQPPAAEDEALLAQLAARYPTIYLVRDRSAQADDEQGRRGAERLLSQLAFKVEEQRVEEWARLIRFSGAGRPVEARHTAVPLGEMALAEATLRLQSQWATPPRAGDPDVTPREATDDGRVTAREGEILQLHLVWEAQSAAQGDYTVFVQLLGEGAVVTQRDRQPGDGLFPTGSMAAGERVTDNLAIPLDLAPGTYQLIVGLYDANAEGAPRLSGPSGDAVMLAELIVQPWDAPASSSE